MLKRICTSQGAMAYAQNVTSVSEMRLLRDQGVRIIMGPAIGQSSGLPDPTVSLPISDIGKQRFQRDHSSPHSVGTTHASTALH
jgi:hypothetical protein